MVSRLIRVFRKKGDDEHVELRTLASDYLDGELDKASTEKVKSHLERCGPCNAFFNTLRATVNLLRSSAKGQAPSGFRDRVREGLRKHRA